MRVPLLALLSGLIALLGCQQTAVPADPTPSETATLSAQVSPPPVEERSTAEYTLKITRAPIDLAHRPLLRAIEAQLAQTRDEFVGQALAAREEGFEFDQPWTLDLTVEPVLQTDSLLHLELSGYEYSGGAHGMPLLGSFTFLPRQDTLMTIEDWFDDAAVWAAISEAAIAGLSTQVEAFGAAPGETLDPATLEWIETGASAEPENFAHYRPLLDADSKIRGFLITFQPYQVGPYAIGTPQVEIPRSVFAAQLKDAYRRLFAD